MSWFKFKGQARIQTTATFALANLEKFVSEKSGKRCEKLGKYWINREKEVNFFPVSAPAYLLFSIKK